MSKQLSLDEAQLYDRQIRLWGIESQEKLRAANCLLINVRALGSEIAKNILLSGINSLTILDDGLVTDSELRTNFLLDYDSIGKNIAEEVVIRAQALNPLVKIVADTKSYEKKELEFFEQFTVIVATGVKTRFLLKIDKVCRAKKIKLITGDVFGMFGYCVADFQDHDYYEEEIKLTGHKRAHDGTQKTTVKVQSMIQYPALNNILILPNTKQRIQGLRKNKRLNEYFFLILILLEFRNQQKRNPQIESKAKDLELLKTIKSQVFSLYEVDDAKLPDHIFDLIFGKVVPVSAIVGAVMGHEVIKAVSHKEVTINNVFLFDPVIFNGKTETIGV